MKCYVTKYNSLYLITAFEPVLEKIRGTDRIAPYVRYGDPIGFKNIPPEFGRTIFPLLDEECVPKKGRLINEGALTHVVSNVENLYHLNVIGDYYNRIEYMCEWFVHTMFGEVKYYKYVHLHGEYL